MNFRSPSRPENPLRALGVGERVFMTWDFEGDRLEDAQALAKKIRATGAVVVGCSYDRMVAKGAKCPACGTDGDLELEPEPPAAA